VSANAGAIQTLETTVNDSEDGVVANAATLTSIQSEINDPANGTSTLATAFISLETEVNDPVDGLAAAHAELALKVEADEVVAAINLSADTIDGARVTITGDTVFENDVQIQGEVQGILKMAAGGEMQGLDESSNVVWRIDEETWAHPTLGSVSFGAFNRSEYGSVGSSDEAPSVFNDEWYITTSAGGTASSIIERRVASGTIERRPGMNTINMSYTAKKEVLASVGTFTHEATIVLKLRNAVTNSLIVESESSPLTTSYPTPGKLSLTANVEGTSGEYFIFEVLIKNNIDGDPSNIGTDRLDLRSYLRSDVVISTKT
jgi:hypothetical protein